MCYGPCIQYLWCAQTCSRRPRWSCDLEVIWSWTYCYEALKEVSWMVCITKSLAMDLLWSVCEMLRNHETPDISDIYDCSIGCYLWDYCATNSFCACISEPHRSVFVNVLQGYGKKQARLVCSYVWNGRLLCYVILPEPETTLWLAVTPVKWTLSQLYEASSVALISPSLCAVLCTRSEPLTARIF